VIVCGRGGGRGKVWKGLQGRVEGANEGEMGYKKGIDKEKGMGQQAT
jgi:hypothetical protein